MQNQDASDHIATLYRFCAQSMQYPDSGWLTEKYFERLYFLLDSLGASKQKQELKARIQSSSDFLEDLQVEHTRLFINGVPHVAAPPYGSVYVDKSLQGQYAERILKRYNEMGYTMKAGADLPDSVVHQLEFLSFLAKDSNCEAEEKFLSEFFLPWFGTFATQVKQESAHPFYHIIVSLIDFFTKEEEEYGV